MSNVEWKYSDHWPTDFTNFRLRDIEAAMENGRDLFLIGKFGGFGGCLLYVHGDLGEAIKHAKKLNKENMGHLNVFRMRMSLENECLEREE